MPPPTEHPSPDQMEALTYQETRLDAPQSPPKSLVFNDKWRSRAFIFSTLFAVLLVGLASAALVWAGHYTPKAAATAAAAGPWFTAVHWLTTVKIASAILAVGWGLVRIDKLLEFGKLLIPIARARFGLAPKAPPK